MTEIQKDHFTEIERERFKLLDKACQEGRQVFFMTGIALGEIKFHKFYLIKGFKTFEDYAESIGFTRRYCNQLILGADVVKSLPPALRDLIKNESAARLLAKIPEKLRPAVITAAGKGKNKITAKDIKKVTPPPRKAKPTPPPRKKSEPKKLDETGIEIPKECLGLWERYENDEIGTCFGALKTIRSFLTQTKDKKDPLFTEVDFNADISALNQIITDLDRAKPYAVCPTCQGKLAAQCLSCKGRGFVSQFYWHTCVPEETRNLRPKGWK